MTWLHRAPRGRLAINTGLALFWQLVRVGSQALWLLAIARKLGAQGYGIFAGIAGLATFLGAFSGLGLGMLLLRIVARDPTRFGAYWHKGLRLTATSGLVVALIFLVASLTFASADTDILALIAIGLSEAVLFPLVSFCSFAFNAHERTGFAAALPAIAALFRLAGASVFLALPLASTIATYSVVHLGATFVAATASMTISWSILRPDKSKESVTYRDLADGLGYASVWAATNALTSLDKTFVLHLAGGTIAGLYASAYRLITIFALPVDALAMSALPRVFRHHADPYAAKRLIGTIFAYSLAFSLIAALLVHFAAAILPFLLGPSFEDAALAARMMAWLLPAYALRMLAGNVLLGLDGQWLRLIVEICGIVLLCAFAWALVPAYGLKGASHMIVATETCLALLTWIVIVFRLRSNAHAT